MSWTVLSILKSKFGLPDCRLDEAAFLEWYTRFVDSDWFQSFGTRGATLNDMVRCSDHGCVEYIRMQLSALKHGGISSEEFESTMRRLDKRVKATMSLRTKAAIIQKSEKIPVASETYLKLAREHARYVWKRSPIDEEVRQFARAMLDEVKQKAIWELVPPVGVFVTPLAEMLLKDRDPDELQGFIDISDVSVLAWDILHMICQKAADQLADEPEERLPHELLVWNLMANHGHAERPDPGTTPRHRPQKLGYKVRNNEIRYTVDLLVQVGMTKSAAREVVAVALCREFSTVEKISREPYSTMDDMHMEAIKDMDPIYYSLYYGPDSDSDHSSSTRARSRRSS